MRIVVCIKQINHIFARTGFDPDENYLVAEDAIFRLNPYDESAFGLALKVKSAIKACEIVILTLGPLIAEKHLRRCFALGGDKLVQIETGMDPDRQDPWQKSRFLARAIRELRGDLVLCGKESLDRRNGQVGAFIARHLDLPFMSAISRLTIDPQADKALITRKAERGKRELWNCSVPAVFSVDHTADRHSLPLLEKRHAADVYQIQTLYYGDVAEKPVAVAVERCPPNPRTKDIIAPDSRLPAFNRIQKLLGGSRVEKDSLMLDGNPNDQVNETIKFLKTHGLLKT